MSETPKPPPLPVVLELAPLPRDQAGPFVLLGIPKTADQEQMESSWAKRIIWARKNQIKVPLEDINWAKDTFNDADKRVQADAASLNLDTTARAVQQLEEKYQGSGAASACRPMDVEKDLSGYGLPVELPNLEEIRQSIKIPEIPREFPIVQHLLEEFAKQPIDPWEISFPES